MLDRFRAPPDVPGFMIGFFGNGLDIRTLSDFHFYAVPPVIKGFGTFPVRAFA